MSLAVSGLAVLGSFGKIMVDKELEEGLDCIAFLLFYCRDSAIVKGHVFYEVLYVKGTPPPMI
jgi:hypothetical protein